MEGGCFHVEDGRDSLCRLFSHSWVDSSPLIPAFYPFHPPSQPCMLHDLRNIKHSRHMIIDFDPFTCYTVRNMMVYAPKRLRKGLP